MTHKNSQIVLLFISPCCYCSVLWIAQVFTRQPYSSRALGNCSKCSLRAVVSHWVSVSSAQRLKSPGSFGLSGDPAHALLWERKAKSHNLPRQSETWPWSLQFPRHSGVGLGPPFLCCYFSEVISEINCRPFSRRETC